MANDLLQKYAGNVPRYTSYPTAPHFHDGITPDVYAGWLRALDGEDRLSLYIHVPYCDRLCWFCACHTKQVRQYAPVKTYLQALYEEIRTVGRHVSRSAPVTAIHLGGGSPTMLAADDLVALKQVLADNFTLVDGLELSVELDPNDLDSACYDALAAIGMTRASLGVQDFEAVVQQAINRPQTFEQTRDVIAEVRQRGVRSVNCDIVYGLPKQTMASFEATVRQIHSLKPDRVALFGYAHVPWMKKHQTMIDEATLPGAEMRFELMQKARSMLLDAGYMAIGIDHFALPADSLARAAKAGQLRRNFQGYSDDEATTIIGLGASSVGSFRQGYVQNIAPTGLYEKAVLAGTLAAARGIALSSDDRIRRWVIECIMCDFGLPIEELAKRFGPSSANILAEAHAICAEDPHITMNGGWFRIAPAARPFARSIAARFDTYLNSGGARHSIAV